MNRKWRLGLLVTFASLVGIGLCVIVLSVLSMPEWRTRWDFSSSGSGSLSAHCQNAISVLPAESKVTFFLIPEDPNFQVNGSAVYPKAFSLLRTAAEEARIAGNGLLDVQILDSNSSPIDFDQARKRLERQSSETIIFEANGQRQVLRFDELFEVVQAHNGEPARLNRQRIDEALATASLRLGSGELKRIAILSAYRPNTSADSQAFAPLLHILKSEGFEISLVKEIPSIDSGFDLLIIPGQSNPFTASDLQAAEDWLASGLPAFVALGFSSPKEVANSWNSLSDNRGVHFDEGLVCQKWRGLTGTSQCANSLEIPAARLAPFHTITKDLYLSQRHLVMVGARPLRISGGDNSYSREQVFWMDRNAWVEISDLPDFAPGPIDPRGPFPLAVASELWNPSASGAGRMLSIGSTGLLYDPSMRERDLLVSSTRWLLGLDVRQTGLVELPSLPFRPTEIVRARIANLAILCLPICTLLIGLVVFLRRRK